MNPHAARVAAGKAAPWVERLARIGFLAKGVLYMTIGVLAVRAALGRQNTHGADEHGAMTEVANAPLGRVLLGVVAVGLVGYALWRVIEGVRDPERRGTDAKGIALRTGYVGSGLVHAVLAFTAARIALHQAAGKNDGDQAKDLSARALELPGGVYALWITALILLGYGAFQVYQAWKAKLDDQLELGDTTESVRRAVYGVSRFGIAARGIVFGAMGMLFVRAATHQAASKAGGIADSMQWLVQLGRWPFFVIATGVIAYGIYQLICAKWMRISVR